MTGNTVLYRMAIAQGDWPGISTTYITGTITTLMMNVARLLSLSLSTPSATVLTLEGRIEQEPPRLAWLAYILAGIMGGYGALHFAALTAFLPLLAVIGAIAIHYVPFPVGQRHSIDKSLLHKMFE